MKIERITKCCRMRFARLKKENLGVATQQRRLCWRGCATSRQILLNLPAGVRLHDCILCATPCRRVWATPIHSETGSAFASSWLVCGTPLYPFSTPDLILRDIHSTSTLDMAGYLPVTCVAVLTQIPNIHSQTPTLSEHFLSKVTSRPVHESLQGLRSFVHGLMSYVSVLRSIFYW